MRVTYDAPGDRPGRHDTYTHTEADAGRFERMTAPRPSRLEDAIDHGYDPTEDYQ